MVDGRSAIFAIMSNQNCRAAQWTSGSKITIQPSWVLLRRWPKRQRPTYTNFFRRARRSSLSWISYTRQGEPASILNSLAHLYFVIMNIRDGSTSLDMALFGICKYFWMSREIKSKISKSMSGSVFDRLLNRLGRAHLTSDLASLSYARGAAPKSFARLRRAGLRSGLQCR